MGEFFLLDSKFEFVWLSNSHLVSIVLIVLLNVAIYLFHDRLSQSSKSIIRKLIAVLLIFLEVSWQLWEVRSGIWSIQGSLPLQLCSISLILTVIMLLSRNKKIYDVNYFWGIAASTQAILTPELYYGFPHFIFLHFFTSHGLILTGCLWMTFGEGYRPSFSALGKAFLALNVYALMVGLFNIFTSSNYMFLCYKPANPSLLDYFGVWPWYILTAELAALVIFVVAALPYLWIEAKEISRRNLKF